MKCVPEKDDPFSFEGPEIYKCKVNKKDSYEQKHRLKFTIIVYLYSNIFRVVLLTGKKERTSQSKRSRRVRNTSLEVPSAL